ncbi:SpoIID/LytB domain-containing protein [Alkalibacter mobilis]|uniref:SpoIID/LytB domain-containing protein n=1 Tax=Alkalibacter mobilis TaxID=2787712 RepID=UPI0018A0ED2E|nr:SpoIID/LytB domain-containing protein [Alkalibacter mobilis]MBF7096373.1 SpoIID/LytB domain-containing protein [Alkalibacter mobilis]
MKSSRKFAVFTVIIIFIFNLLPTTFAADDYKTIRVRITMDPANIKTASIKLNGDYMLSTAPELVLPQGDYTVAVEPDNANLRLKGQGIDQVIGPDATFVRLKYSSSTVSTLSIKNTVYKDHYVSVNDYLDYLGNMRFHISSGNILITNHIPLEQYLYGVVSAEMGNWAEKYIEALKAQAVCARGYAIRKIQASTSKDFDIGDRSNEQAYVGFKSNYTNVIGAVDGTKGQVVTYGGSIAQTYYAASNGGQTEWISNVWGASDASYPYIVQKDDPYDVKNTSSWTEEFFVPKAVEESDYKALVSDEVSEYIVRITTETSNLNVRSGPTTDYEIIGKAGPDEIFEWVSTDEQTGWHKIKYPKDGGLVEGYVSNNYSEKVLNGHFIYSDPVLKDLQTRAYENMKGSYDVTAATQIKIITITSLVNGQPRWSNEGSRSFVTAKAELILQYEKPDKSLSDPVTVKDVTIDLMNKNDDDKYVYSHHYLNANLRMRGVRAASRDGIEGFEVTNARFGHGIGMSQRGAQQMAVEGKTYQEILSFYYVGTKLTTFETSVPELPNRGTAPSTTPVPTVASTTLKIQANSITGVSEKTEVSVFMSGLKVTNGTASLVTAANKAKISGAVGTGDVVHIKDPTGKITKSYTVVIYGDTNGDGAITIADLLKVQRHLLDVSKLPGVYSSAADVSKDNAVTIADLLRIQRHLLDVSKIAQ